MRGSRGRREGGRRRIGRLWVCCVRRREVVGVHIGGDGGVRGGLLLGARPGEVDVEEEEENAEAYY